MDFSAKKTSVAVLVTNIFRAITSVNRKCYFFFLLEVDDVVATNDAVAKKKRKINRGKSCKNTPANKKKIKIKNKQSGKVE